MAVGRSSARIRRLGSIGLASAVVLSLGVAGVAAAATPSSSMLVASGEITALGSASVTVTGANGAASTIDTTSSTKVLMDGINIDSLSTGEQVVVFGTQDGQSVTATAIVILPSAMGVITAVGSGSITVLQSDGTAVTVDVTSLTTVHGASSGAVGQEVQVFGAESSGVVTATTINVQPVAPAGPAMPVATGVITAVGSGSITVLQGDGTAVVVDMTSGTVVHGASSVAVGQEVQIFGTESSGVITATTINVQPVAPAGPAMPVVTGVITAVGSGSITVLQGDGTAVVVDTTSSKVGRGPMGKGKGNTELRVGEMVQVQGTEMDGSVVATSIDIVGSPAVPAGPAMPVVTGVIIAVGSGSITVLQSDGTVVMVDTTSSKVGRGPMGKGKGNTELRVGEDVAVSETAGGTMIVDLMHLAPPAPQGPASQGPVSPGPLRAGIGFNGQQGNGAGLQIPLAAGGKGQNKQGDGSKWKGMDGPGHGH